MGKKYGGMYKHTSIDETSAGGIKEKSIRLFTIHNLGCFWF